MSDARPKSPLEKAGLYRARTFESLLTALSGSEVTLAVDLRSGPTITGVVKGFEDEVALFVDSRGQFTYVRVAAIDSLTIIDVNSARVLLVE